jgi:uncharacterized membrane protein/mono/diheme cytochrome c family protein
MLAPILVLLILLIVLPPDGSERAQWVQFIGRFHPLAVHLPIGLILLVPILELVGRRPRFSYLHPSAGFVLGLTAVSAIAAAALGWCLARSGGYSGPLVTQHMWGGLSLSFFCWICWMARGRFEVGRWRLIYPLALTTTIAVMTWTGYRGGQLVRGEDHLTEVMPGGMRKLLGVSAPLEMRAASSPNTFYGARIEPIFAGHCITCHGRDKHKSNLRLDSYGSLLRGGKHGPVIKAKDLRGSELFRRISLPATDDDFMPKQGKRPLSADQVKLIELWIAAGASDALPVDAIKNAPAQTTTAAEVTFERIDAKDVAKQRASLAPSVAKLQKQYPNILEYESRGSANLVLNASLSGDRFRDADLAALAPVADRVVVADLSRTGITDHSAPTIAAMKRLRVLRLMDTKITDVTARTFGQLELLESLSVFGTGVTSASLPTVAQLPKLRHVYVGETTIRADGSIPDALKGKVLF